MTGSVARLFYSYGVVLRQRQKKTAPYFSVQLPSTAPISTVMPRTAPYCPMLLRADEYNPELLFYRLCYLVL